MKPVVANRCLERWNIFASEKDNGMSVSPPAEITGIGKVRMHRRTFPSPRLSATHLRGYRAIIGLIDDWKMHRVAGRRTVYDGQSFMLAVGWANSHPARIRH